MDSRLLYGHKAIRAESGKPYRIAGTQPPSPSYRSKPQKRCHPEQSEGPAVAFALAFLSVIPFGNLLLRPPVTARIPAFATLPKVRLPTSSMLKEDAL